MKTDEKGLFHRDNVLTYVLDSMAATRDCGLELVDHYPYSVDLAPSIYLLFLNVKKKNLAGNLYSLTKLLARTYYNLPNHKINLTTYYSYYSHHKNAISL